ncbi:UNVERIFIED_CONTAM: Retrovirus-related Pol polyprotein from transposon RE1 [Sesamum radiatum]|uniref:Retrovirus-related Pol polyprotein from transposon RE1 n=1 Tax=Sesamum radiatum TaxID=300843 RepID=A0AAW2U9G3_SESRA
MKPDGSVERYKARLVAKGYNQVEGVDYTDCFAHVAEAVTFRLFLAILVTKGFLHGFLDGNICMEPPEGYELVLGHVCKLKKFLYGLKQASL